MDWFLYDKDLRHERANICHPKRATDTNYGETCNSLSVDNAARIIGELIMLVMLQFTAKNWII